VTRRHRTKFDQTLEYYRRLIAGGNESPSANIGIAGLCAIRGEKNETHRYLDRALKGAFLQYALLERHPYCALRRLSKTVNSRYGLVMTSGERPSEN